MLRRKAGSTIQASLAIRHNTLSLDQVTAVIDGKPVLGLPGVRSEVRNAFCRLWGNVGLGPSSADLLQGPMDV